MKRYVMLMLLLHTISVMGTASTVDPVPGANPRALLQQALRAAGRPTLHPAQPANTLVAAQVRFAVRQLIRNGGNTQVLDWLRLKCEDPGFSPPRPARQLLEVRGITTNGTINPETIRTVQEYTRTKAYFDAIKARQREKLQGHVAKKAPERRAVWEQSLRDGIVVRPVQG